MKWNKHYKVYTVQEKLMDNHTQELYFEYEEAAETAERMINLEKYGDLLVEVEK